LAVGADAGITEAAVFSRVSFSHILREAYPLIGLVQQNSRKSLDFCNSRFGKMVVLAPPGRRGYSNFAKHL
jgi:hypothetical protein